MINYCTLFDSRYLSRGLAMYHSLERYCPSFHLYIFAFDDVCYSTLRKLHLQYATIISLTDFEDEQLLAIKPTRTEAEYCWTCTPSIIKYAIQTYQLDSCTYLDADLLFFADPSVLLGEMGERSVLITEHRYTPEYDQFDSSGKYCVQFMCFKDTEEGMTALEWWRSSCIAWCYNRIEEGKFGDQKYLDDWASRFKGVHELKHLGGGVAPWNVQQYDFEHRDGILYGRETATAIVFPVVFYHYHAFKYAEANAFLPTSVYRLSENDLQYIYGPYVYALKAADRALARVEAARKFHEAIEIPRIRKSLRRMYLLFIKGQFNRYYHQSYFLRKWLIS
ncbi:glycosyl transferase [Sphingobacterium sp. SYP-B4668]|uniref:glycosyl transferase n=1 Tax=Sphingobacterium sp. SYP-B4668 TaxID=2996035 RepID=UPI0022DE8108|nr:glycosyl transferase [Sphingobacterium sp. SYP-B4668]